LQGYYIPLETRGSNRENIIAFARRLKNTWAVVMVARIFTKIVSAGDISFKKEVWQEIFLSLPHDAPKELVNILTGETIKSIPDELSKSLPLANLFPNLPVALLFGRAA
jgi:maltooligosyltrehalose synthase